MLIRELFQGELPDLVLFDLDGTLVDSVPDLAQAIDSALAEANLPLVGEGAVRNWVGNGAEMLVKRALTGEMDPKGEMPMFDQVYQSFLRFYGKATSDQSQLYPGVLECLNGLANAGIKLGLVTNKPIAFTRTMLSGFGLTQYFDVVLGGDSLPVKKPSPEPLLSAMATCQAKVEKTLMVGDSKSDIGAARAAGCPVVCVPYGYNHGLDIHDFMPDKVVQRLDELIL